MSCPSSHKSLEVPVGQKKNFWYHLSGVVVDLLEVHFIPGQIKNPAFFESQWYTGEMVCQIWALWRDWKKNEPQEGQQALSMMCDLQLCPCRKSKFFCGCSWMCTKCKLTSIAGWFNAFWVIPVGMIDMDSWSLDTMSWNLIFSCVGVISVLSICPVFTSLSVIDLAGLVCPSSWLILSMTSNF